jgi:serine/threonine protein kinase
MSVCQPVAVIGRYALYDEIAAGGMAKVHLGRLLGPVGFARTVAIKRLHQQYARDPEFVSMFLDEARLAGRIRHPHVVSTFDVVALSGELFLVMDYVHGVSLSKLLRAVVAQKIRIPVDILASVMVGALHGLHAAHEARSEHGQPLGIVHRDVSPQNIMVGSDGMARVLDFGVAKASWRIQTTRDGQLKGKLSYMAPEQVNAGEVGPWTDVYSAAIVFWEALTNQRLFNNSDSAAILARFTKTEPVLPPSTHNDQVSPTLDAIVVKALESDVSRRYLSAHEMADAIEANLQIASTSAVGRWLQSVVQEDLDKHSALIAEIESGSTVNVLPSKDDAPSVRKILASLSRRVSTEAETETFVPVLDPAGDLASQSLISMTRSPSVYEVKAGRRKRLIGIGAAGASLLALGVTAAVWPRPRTESVLVSQSSPAIAQAAPAATPAPAPAPTPTAASTIPVVQLSSLDAQADTPPAQPRSAKGISKPSTTRVGGGCSPPYSVDSRGIRHMKLACLR